VLCRAAYLDGYNADRRGPAWVTWPLTAEHAIGCLERKNTFAGDPDLKALKIARAVPADYDGTGYDRGHFADADDMLFDPTVERQSFYMSNMAPQAPGLNEQQWEQLEAMSRAWALQGYGPLYITVVPIWDPVQTGVGPATIGKHQVAVPRAFAKVIVSPSTGKALAFEMDNVPIPKGDLFPFAVSIAQVEQDSGVTIPLPAWADTMHVLPPWPGDLAAVETAKKKSCAKK
jgi:endonuclease G